MMTYTAVMTMMPAVTREDIRGKSEKPIQYDIPNAHLVDYKEKTTFIEHHQKKEATSLTILSVLTFVLQTGEVAAAIRQEGQAIEKVMIIKNVFCKADGFTKFQIPPKMETFIK